MEQTSWAAPERALNRRVLLHAKLRPTKDRRVRPDLSRGRGMGDRAILSGPLIVPVGADDLAALVTVCRGRGGPGSGGVLWAVFGAEFRRVFRGVVLADWPPGGGLNFGSDLRGGGGCGGRCSVS